METKTFWIIFISGIVLIVATLWTVLNSSTGIKHTKTNLKEESQGGHQPNIVFIMLDDLGFNDVSWNNPDVRTPHMETLAHQGVILNRNYVHTLCTPSRGELLTGKYAHRLGLQVGVVQPVLPNYIPLEEKLLGERLQKLGYTTHQLGKWHVGHCCHDALPTRRGFDTFYGTWMGYLDSYTKCSQSEFANDTGYAWVDQEEPLLTDKDVHVTELIRERALEILQESRENPFFMFLSFPAPHVPIQVPKKYVADYDHIQDQWRKEYLGMVTHTDDVIGDIVQKLKTTGAFDNTVFVMSSDNGGEGGMSSNYPLRGGKLTVFEGGTRVPGFISGPRKIIQKNKYINNQRFHITDWLPTLISLAHGKVDTEGEGLDGVDQSDMVRHGGQSRRRETLYHLDTTYKRSWYATGAISYDNYKLILGVPGIKDGWEQDRGFGLVMGDNILKTAERRETVDERDTGICEGSITMPYNFSAFMEAKTYMKKFLDQELLFDIEADPEERQDLSKEMPEKVKELRERFDRHAEKEMTPKDLQVYPLSVTQRDGSWISGWC